MSVTMIADDIVYRCSMRYVGVMTEVLAGQNYARIGSRPIWYIEIGIKTD